MEGTHLKIDAQWARFEARVHPSPWSGPGVLLHQQCGGIRRRPQPRKLITKGRGYVGQASRCYLTPLTALLAFALVYARARPSRSVAQPDFGVSE
jgi:hypothetical protein